MANKPAGNLTLKKVGDSMRSHLTLNGRAPDRLGITDAVGLGRTAV
jgi:hypothetical protein